MTDTNFNRQRLLRRLQRTTKQVVDDPNIKIKTARATKEGTHTPLDLEKTKKLNLLKDTPTTGMQKVSKLKWQSIHPANKPRRQSIRLKRSTTRSTTAAKHPPKKRGGKASAKRRPMQSERGGRNKAQAGTEAGTPREEQTTTTRTSERGWHTTSNPTATSGASKTAPQRRERRHRRRRRPTNIVKVFTRRAHWREGGGKDDAFNKIKRRPRASRSVEILQINSSTFHSN